MKFSPYYFRPLLPLALRHHYQSRNEEKYFLSFYIPNSFIIHPSTQIILLAHLKKSQGKNQQKWKTRKDDSLHFTSLFEGANEIVGVFVGLFVGVWVGVNELMVHREGRVEGDVVGAPNMYN